MKKIIKSTPVNIFFELILISILSFTLCACSVGTSENAQSPETTVSETDNTADVSDIQEDSSLEDNSEENVPDVIEEEIPPTVTILGTEYGLDTEMLDLSNMAPEDIIAVAESIVELPELKTINLMPEEEETSLLLSDVVLLKEAAPDVHIVYEFDLFENHISTSDTEVQYINTQIGNEGEESIRQALTILDECEYFLLDDCGIDDEIMAGIREDFPDTKVVWRIHVGGKSALTDDQIIRMTHSLNDSMTEPLKYCNEVLYMDLGHNSGITDISFIENMPLLECLILSEAQFKDLSPVANCHNLIWLELIYCLSFDDISVISEMDSIKYLNISNTKISDISGIMNMNLERFCCIENRVKKEDFEAFKELHPDCLSVSTGTPYGYAWRYDDYGYHYFSYYARMREVFRYDQRSPGGFKMPEEETE